MDKLKWLLVGAGQIANNRVAPALVNAENSELVAICDISAKSASTLAEKHSVKKIYDDIDTALADSGVDAVYAAVPVAHHIPIGLRSLDAGKHVIVEKPMGLNSSECRKLVDAAGSSGRIAACAYYRRFSGQYQYTKQALERSEIGQIVGGSANHLFYMNVASMLNGKQKWIFDKAVSGGGILCHLGSHFFDIIVGLFGLPLSVSARCGAFNAGLNVEDHAAIIIELPGGGFFTLNFNVNSQTAYRHDFEISGTKGRISWPGWPPHTSCPVVVSRGNEKYSQEVTNHDNFHLPLVQDVINAVLKGGKPLCSVEEGWKTSLLMDAIYRSAEEKRAIKPGE